VLAAFVSAHAQDATGVLRRASAAMGADELHSLRYTGSGTGASYGQAFRPDTQWPKLNIPSFTRQIDYRAAAMHEEVMRGRAEKQGGGARAAAARPVDHAARRDQGGAAQQCHREVARRSR
jgi:hypothetical protein